MASPEPREPASGDPGAACWRCGGAGFPGMACPVCGHAAEPPPRSRAMILAQMTPRGRLTVYAQLCAERDRRAWQRNRLQHAAFTGWSLERQVAMILDIEEREAPAAGSFQASRPGGG